MTQELLERAIAAGVCLPLCRGCDGNAYLHGDLAHVDGVDRDATGLKCPACAKGGDRSPSAVIVACDAWMLGRGLSIVTALSPDGAVFWCAYTGDGTEEWIGPPEAWTPEDQARWRLESVLAVVEGSNDEG